MKGLLLRSLVALLVVAGPNSLHAFELSWTDQYDETTYTLSGPDLVCPGDTVTVTATASDPLYPDVMVAAPWSISDNDSVIDSGFAIWLDGSGLWVSSYSLVYQGMGTHEILFTAQDLGHGGGGHGWEWFELAGIIEVTEATAINHGTWGSLKRFYR